MTGSDSWLAIDSAGGSAGSVALLDRRGRVSTSRIEPRRHASELIPICEKLLDESGQSLRDLRGLVVGDGPGSFTGIRIAFASAAGIISGADGLELYAIPSLLGLAHDFHTRKGVNSVAAAYDALRGECFLYRAHFEGGRLVSVDGPSLVPVAQVSELRMSGVPVVTDMTGEFPDTVDSAPGLLALRAQGFGRRCNLDALDPVYGRKAEAQVRWEDRYGRELPASPGE